LAIFNAFESICERNGMDKQSARQVVAQTAIGTARLLLETSMTTEELIRFVTSPNGTTAAGLEVAKELDLVGSFTKVVERAIERAGELGQNDEKDLEKKGTK
jgi:pyrroline-5-carboxylate reductase